MKKAFALGVIGLAATLGTAGIAPSPARAFVPTSELTDVSPDHWAYGAIKALVDKYQVMEGFNDNTFRGSRYVTRYEIASILAKVMNRVEELITTATGTAPTPIIPPSVNPEDLRMIAKLQREFRDELAILKDKTDAMDGRLASLESRVRLHGEMEMFYRTPTTKGNLRGQDNSRVVTTLGLDARLAPDLTYAGELAVFNNGVAGFSNGHLWSEGASRGVPGSAPDSASPLYVRRSAFSWTPANLNLSVGMLSFAEAVPAGSVLKSGFDSLPFWSEGQGGYGFVGTPAVNRGGGTFRYAGSRAAWMPGVNAVQDILDPDSSSVNLPGSAPGLAIRSDWGRFDAGLGIHSGVPGANLTFAAADIPQSFPAIGSEDHGYALFKVGTEAGAARVSAYCHVDNGFLGAGSEGNGAGTVLDLGNDEMGVSASFASITRPSAYGPLAGYFHEASLALNSGNFLGTGMGLGLASKAGKMGEVPAGGSNFDWTSTGGYLRFPLFSLIPSFTLAAQTSGTGFLDNNLGSGWSALAEFRIASLPKVMLEYDRGKFSGGDKGLLTKEVPSDEQLILGTGVRF